MKSLRANRKMFKYSRSLALVLSLDMLPCKINLREQISGNPFFSEIRQKSVGGLRP